MASVQLPTVVALPFKIWDYLTDGKRLYRVERISTDGVYTLENCETEFTYKADSSFIKSLKLVSSKEVNN